MTTTQSTTITKFDKMVDQYKVARNNHGNSRMGSVKGQKAEATMDRLVAQAERGGFLTEFCRVVNQTTYEARYF